MQTAEMCTGKSGRTSTIDAFGVFFGGGFLFVGFVINEVQSYVKVKTSK